MIKNGPKPQTAKPNALNEEFVAEWRRRLHEMKIRPITK